MKLKVPLFFDEYLIQYKNIYINLKYLYTYKVDTGTIIVIWPTSIPTAYAKY